MSVKIEIYDATTPLLEKIALLSRGVALESLSVAGSKIQKAARSALRSHSHNWFQYVRDGKVIIKKEENALRELGLRMSHSSGDAANPSSMANFITSYLNEKSLLVVVGGRHKSLTPTKFDNGEAVGKMGRVSGVSKQSQAILHKLNTGERTITDKSGNIQHTWDGQTKSMRRFQNAKYKGRRFMEAGYSSSASSVVDSMTKRYELLLGKAVNRATIKVKKVG